MAAVTDERRLHQMLDELRRRCEPKSNQNPRYLRYSNAVTALRCIINDLSPRPHDDAGRQRAHSPHRSTVTKQWLAAVHHAAQDTDGHLLSPVEPPTVAQPLPGPGAAVMTDARKEPAGRTLPAAVWGRRSPRTRRPDMGRCARTFTPGYRPRTRSRGLRPPTIPP